MKKRILALGTVAVLAFGVSACGGGGKAEEVEPSTVSVEQTEVTEAPDEADTMPIVVEEGDLEGDTEEVVTEVNPDELQTDEQNSTDAQADAPVEQADAQADADATAEDVVELEEGSYTEINLDEEGWE